MAVAIVLILLIVGSIAFHFLSPWWFVPLASNWGTIDDTVIITFWVTGAVFVAVNLFMGYCVLRYRNRGEGSEPAHYQPENNKLEIWLTVITTIGVAAMLAPGLYVWNEFVHVPEEAWEFEAVGEQWRWSFRLPGEDNKLGTTDIRFVSQENPFGMNPDDPTGQDDLLVDSNVMHLPLDKPVKVLLRSKDVLHDFAVPQFRVKMDLVPGMVTYLWFTPTRTGTFEILCEELCGVGHFTMRGRVMVDEQEDFDAWAAEQLTYAELNAIGPGNPDIGKALYPVCGACHGINGEGNLALNSPKLSGQEDWYIRRQILNFKSGVRGAHDDDIYGQQMAPMVAMLTDESSIRHVTAYINTLPPAATSASISGDALRGEKLFVTCSACHGTSGEGNHGTNSPKLAGQEDWYLKRQLENFKKGIRGSHPDDLFGPQMRSMSKILRSEEDVADVIAYINTLPTEDVLQLADTTFEGED